MLLLGQMALNAAMTDCDVPGPEIEAWDTLLQY
jgi:hypothetical protein